MTTFIVFVIIIIIAFSYHHQLEKDREHMRQKEEKEKELRIQEYKRSIEKAEIEKKAQKIKEIKLTFSCDDEEASRIYEIIENSSFCYNFFAEDSISKRIEIFQQCQTEHEETRRFILYINNVLNPYIQEKNLNIDHSSLISFKEEFQYFSTIPYETILDEIAYISSHNYNKNIDKLISLSSSLHTPPADIFSNKHYRKNELSNQNISEIALLFAKQFNIDISPNVINNIDFNTKIFELDFEDELKEGIDILKDIYIIILIQSNEFQTFLNSQKSYKTLILKQNEFNQEFITKMLFTESYFLIYGLYFRAIHYTLDEKIKSILDHHISEFEERISGIIKYVDEGQENLNKLNEIENKIRELENILHEIEE